MAPTEHLPACGNHRITFPVYVALLRKNFRKTRKKITLKNHIFETLLVERFFVSAQRPVPGKGMFYNWN